MYYTRIYYNIAEMLSEPLHIGLNTQLSKIRLSAIENVACKKTNSFSGYFINSPEKGPRERIRYMKCLTRAVFYAVAERLVLRMPRF